MIQGHGARAVSIEQPENLGGGTPSSQEDSPLAPIPPGYVNLDSALRNPQVQHNVIGVCVDFLEATKSKGSDFTLKFTLRDPEWIPSGGVDFRFFRKRKEDLPAIRHQGDVVVLRHIKTANAQGGCVLSNYSTQWTVLPAAQMCMPVKSLQESARYLRTDSASRVGEAELRYAKYIARREDPSTWRTLKGTTRLHEENMILASGAQPPPRAQRFTQIKDIELPHSGELFVELLGEVRKTFSTDSRTELSITDYTSHPRLYDQKYEPDGEGRDGDDFAYIQNTEGKWPGPWGRMTLVVTLWDAHHEYARSHAKEGTFVYLRNVKVGMDKENAKLEGRCHGDKDYPQKVNIEVREPSKNGDRSNPLIELIRRKKEYEEQAVAEQLPFMRSAQNAKRKAGSESTTKTAEGRKTKKARARDRKKKQAKATTTEHGREMRGNPSMQDRIQPIVRCHNYDVPLKTISDILDPAILQRTTAAGNAFSVPFQNCKYKSKVRVVDFFPDDVRDFAVPRLETEYDCLSDNGGGQTSDVSEVDLSGAQRDHIKWSWRFSLLVEDARPQPGHAKSPPQMSLLVADTDGDYLLDMEAFDMRDESNKSQLALVKEKLFLLWGDLQERKEEAGTSDIGDQMANGRPFECFIKEYGAVSPPRLKVAERGDERYERMFRLFGVTV